MMHRLRCKGVTVALVLALAAACGCPRRAEDGSSRIGEDAGAPPAVSEGPDAGAAPEAGPAVPPEGTELAPAQAEAVPPAEEPAAPPEPVPVVVPPDAGPIGAPAPPEATVGPTGEGPRPAPLQWTRPRFEQRKQERLDMVRVQIEGRDIRNRDVLDALREVPRHFFVPSGGRNLAYADRPLEIGHGQTISQPYIVALMTELLDVKPGHKVLEIGTGSGYQAAVLSELTPHVFSIEILKALHESAAARLQELGYETIETRRGDGYYGWTEAAPFDAIIVTAAAGHVPPPLTGQLKPGGRMAIPVGAAYETQQLLLITKDLDGRLTMRSVLPVRFVPMTGRARDGL